MTKKTQSRSDTVNVSRDLDDTRFYEQLSRAFPLRPIRSHAQNDQAMSIVDELFNRLTDLSSIEKEYLEVLSDLIQKFEKDAYAEDYLMLSPGDLIRSLIDASDIKQSQLAKELDVSP